jgi:hypothetical protein
MNFNLGILWARHDGSNARHFIANDDSDAFLECRAFYGKGCYISHAFLECKAFLWQRLWNATCKAFYRASARISKGQGYQGLLRKWAEAVLAKKGQFMLYKEK